MSKTTKKENIYDSINKAKASEAKTTASKAAIETMITELNTIAENERLHAYLLAPYAQYTYTYEYKDEDGNMTKKSNTGETLFPIMDLLNDDKQADLTFRLLRFQGRLEMLFTARARNDREAEFKTDAKCKLQDIFDVLKSNNDDIHYNANLYDLETTYVLSFKKGGLKSGRSLSAKKAEALLETVIYCLWSKLVEKGYTLGMKTQLPEPRPVEAKKTETKPTETTTKK